MQDNEKIKALRKYFRLNQTEFGKIIDKKQTTVANIEKGVIKVNGRLVRLLNNHFNFDFDSWDGLSNILEVGVKENPPEKSSGQNVSIGNRNIVSVPLFEVGAAAGAGNYVLDNNVITDTMFFDVRWLKSALGVVNTENLFLCYATDDSMDDGSADSIQEGDLLLVDKGQVTGNGGIFIVMVNKSELRVKKVYQKLNGLLKLISLNPKFEKEIYTPNSSNDMTIEVIGRVLWNGSKRV